MRYCLIERIGLVEKTVAQASRCAPTVLPIMTITDIATANAVGNMIRSYKSPPSPKSQAQKNRPNDRFFMQRLGLGARRERWLTEAKISEQTECS